MSNINAVEYFQNREREKIVFDKFLQSSGYQVLIFSGFPGLGKSTILNWLNANKCESADIPSLVINFEGRGKSFWYHDIDWFFRKVLGNLNSYDLISDEDWIIYERKRSRILNDLSDRFSLIQVNMTQSGGDNYQAVHLGLSEERNFAMQTAQNKFTGILLDCLREYNGDELVIFLDSFEILQEQDQRRFWEIFQDISEIIHDLKVVVGIRSTNNSMPPHSKEIPLNNLSHPDSDELLDNLGVSDATYKLAAFNNLAKGHPGITKLAADAWLEGFRVTSSFDVPNLANKLPEAIQWIHNEFIKRLDEPLREVVSWLPLLRSFNLETINEILLEDSKPLDMESFFRLCDYSFIEYIPDTMRRKCHDLMRYVWLKHLKIVHKSQFISMHRRAYNYYKNIDSVDAIYHYFFYDISAALKEWDEIRRSAKREKNYELVEKIISTVESLELELPAETVAYIAMKKAHFYRQVGDFQKSHQAYIQASNYYETNPSEFASHTRHGFAVLRGLQGHYEEARNLFEKALSLNENDIYVLNSWAVMETRRGNLHEAKDLVSRSYELNTKNVSTLNILATIENSLGNENEARELRDAATQLEPLDPVTLRYRNLFEGNEEDSHNEFEEILSIAVSRRDVSMLNTLIVTCREFGKFGEAHKIIKFAHDINPNHAPTYNNWALVVRDQGNWEKARELLEKSLSIDPIHIHSINALAILESKISDEPARSRELFEKSINLEPDNVETLETWAWIEAQRNNHELATRLFERTIALRPYDERLLAACASSYLKLGHEEQAKKLFEKIFQINPENINNITAWSRLERRRGKYTKAKELFDIANQIAPEHWKTLYLKALELKKKGKNKQAIDLFEEVNRLNSKHVPTLINWATLLKEKGKLQKAANLLMTAHDYDPNSLSVVENWAIVEWDLKNYERASELFNIVLEREQNRITLRRLAKLEWERKNYDEARRYLDLILQSSPNNLKTMLDWVVLEHQIENLNKVNEIIDRALSCNVPDIRWLIALAKEETTYKNSKNARLLYEKALQVSPKDKKLLTSYADFEHKADNYERAALLYRAANEADPSEPIILTQWAILEVNFRKNYELASELFSKAHELEPLNIRTLETWARIELKHGKLRKANILFEKIIQLKPDDQKLVFESAKLTWKVSQKSTNQAQKLFRRAATLSNSPLKSEDSLKVFESAKLISKSSKKSKSQARKLFRRAATLSHSPSAKGNILNIWGNFEWQDRNFAQARRLFRESLSNCPANTKLLKTWASQEQKEGNEDAFFDLLSEALKIEPDNIAILELLGRREQQRGNTQVAIQLFQRIIKIESQNT